MIDVQQVPFEWWYWLIELVLAGFAVCLMGQGLVRLSADGEKWKTGAPSLIALVLCLVAVFAHHVAIRYLAQDIRALEAWPGDYRPSTCWQGTEFDRAECAKEGAMLSFIRQGYIHDYLDEDGAWRLFQPSVRDRDVRAEKVRRLERVALERTMHAAAAFVWFLVPWLGVVLAFVPRARGVLVVMPPAAKAAASLAQGADPES